MNDEVCPRMLSDAANKSINADLKQHIDHVTQCAMPTCRTIRLLDILPIYPQPLVNE